MVRHGRGYEKVLEKWSSWLKENSWFMLALHQHSELQHSEELA